MRLEKTSMVDEVRQWIDDNEFLFLADYLGLTVDQMSELRTCMRENDAIVKIVKNSFIGIGLGDELRDKLKEGLTGPTALVVGSGDAAAVAKALKKFADGKNLPVLKIGCLNNTVLSSEDITAMADLPSKEILLGKLVGTIAAPMTQLVGVAGAKVRSLLYVLKAVEEKKQKAA